MKYILIVLPKFIYSKCVVTDVGCCAYCLIKLHNYHHKHNFNNVVNSGNQVMDRQIKQRAG